MPGVEEWAGSGAPLRFEIGVEVAAVAGFGFVGCGKAGGEAVFEEKEVAFDRRRPWWLRYPRRSEDEVESANI